MAWPDHGAPEESDYKIIIKILEYVRYVDNLKYY